MHFSFGRSIDSYLTIFKKAFTTTIRHKELWVFGIFAAIINNGAVFHRVFDIFWKLQPADKIGMDMVGKKISNMPWIVNYIETTIQTDAWRATIMIFGLVVLFSLIAFIIISSQQILIIGVHRSAKRRKKLNLKKLLKQLSHGKFWSIFATDAITIIATIIILGISTFPLALLINGNIATDKIILLAFYIILLPIIFCINIIAMLTLINIVRHGNHLIHALMHTLRILKKHWLVSIEVSALLFAINIIFGLMVLLITMIVIIPIGLLGAVLMGIGWTSSVIFFTITAGLISFIATILYTGTITTFNYSTWMELSEKLERKSIIPAIESWFLAKIFR